MKKILSLIATASLILTVFASCSENVGEQTKKDPSQQTSQTAEDTQTNAEDTEGEDMEELKETAVSYKTLTADKAINVATHPEYRNKHTLNTYSNVEYETYLGVCADFKVKGFDTYSSMKKGNIYASTFVNETDFYHVYWHEKDKKLRVAEAPGEADTLPVNDPMAIQGDKVTSVTQLKSTKVYGMGYIITLRDGSFIIIDGGWIDEHDRIYEKLVKLNGSEENIIIRAWIITHAHNDHYDAFTSFAPKYADKVTLERFIYASETPDLRVSGWGSFLAWGYVYDYISMFKDTKVLYAHTGMDLVFGDVRMEVLFSCDDMLIDFIPENQNNTSLVTRFYTTDMNMLFLADAGEDVSKILENYYGDYLKSDMCQAAHHGVENFPLRTYKIIKPEVMFYPCAERLYNAKERFYEVRMALKNSSYVKTIIMHEKSDITRPLFHNKK